MSDRFTFTGHEPSRGYMNYRDLDTGLALVAQHGQSYRIAATEGIEADENGRVVRERYPVPPQDGRWVPAASADGKAAKARAKLAADSEPGEPPGDGGSAGTETDTGIPDGSSGAEGGAQ